MKKFLTVLLALSVVFTYSFSAVGTAFADDTTYDDSQYKAYYQELWNAEGTGYYQAALKVAEDNYAAGLGFSGAAILHSDFNVKASDIGTEAYSGTSNIKWTKDAYAKLKAQVRTDIEEALGKAYAQVIENQFSSTGDRTTTSPNAALGNLGAVEVYDGVTLNDITTDYLKAATARLDDFKKYQADDIYEKVSKTIKNTSETSYTDENANKISALKDEAINAIAKIQGNNGITDRNKEIAYIKAFADFKADVDAIPTKDQTDYNDTNTEASVAAATAKYVEYGLGALYNYVKLSEGDPVVSQLQKAANKNIYEKGNGNSATIFGVKVANVKSPTLPEATAVNKAMRAAFEDAAPIIKAYGLATSAGKIDDLYINVTAAGPQVTPYLASINKVIEAQNVYADVVAEGDAMKETTLYGVKVYEDANVEAAVKEAEALVYADLGEESFDTAKNYIVAAAEKLGVDLYATNFEYKAFRNAIAQAQAKFYKDYGTANQTAQIKVIYGENKTAEEDYVYLKSTYAKCRGNAWEAIATEACKALEIAESYAEIDEILADAAASMSKLMSVTDEVAVSTAIDKYQKALEDDKESFIDKMGLTDYLQDSYDEACADGKTLIGAANTLDEVVSAYNDALALIKGIPTKAELDAAKKTAIDKIAALPATTSLTSNDKDAVVDALSAYSAYVGMYGATASSIYNSYILNADLDAVLRPIGEDLQKRVDDMVKTVEKNTPANGRAITDNQAAALVALADDIGALLNEAYEFNALAGSVNAVQSDLVYTLDTIDNLEKLEAVFNAENGIWLAQLHNLLVQANTANTVAEKKAVVEAYEKLTDRQKYKMEQNLKTLIEEIKSDLVTSVEALKITAGSSAVKGAITVKWSVKGDAEAADGYQIYRSVKKNSGFGTTPIFTTTKLTYKNTKSLKKGTRYYYKVRAYAEIDGVKYYSDWSNKAYRIAK